MDYFDSHAHLSSSEILPDIRGVLSRAKAAGVKRILNICTDPESLKQGLLLTGVENAGATTPHDVDKEGESAFPLFAKAAREGKLVAVGETGLDYYNATSDREMQKKYLKRYLELAQETGCR